MHKKDKVKLKKCMNDWLKDYAKSIQANTAVETVNFDEWPLQRYTKEGSSPDWTDFRKIIVNFHKDLINVRDNYIANVNVWFKHYHSDKE